MSIEEQDRIMGMQLRTLREKERERQCLISKAKDINARLTPVLGFLINEKYGGHHNLPLDELPSTEEIIQTTNQLIQLTEQIRDLRRILGLNEEK